MLLNCNIRCGNVVNPRILLVWVFHFSIRVIERSFKKEKQTACALVYEHCGLFKKFKKQKLPLLDNGNT